MLLRSRDREIITKRQCADLDYAQRYPPYTESNLAYGRIDFIFPIQPANIALRGWIFSTREPIAELTLHILDVDIMVHALGLERKDVAAIYPFFSNSINSGFVAVLPLEARQIYSPLCFAFKAKTVKKRIIMGHLCEL